MSKKFLFVLLLGVFYLSISFQSSSLALANQELSGVVSENITLKAQDSPYNCSNNLIITPNATLTLEPNTTLTIHDSLILQGNLLINQGAKIEIYGNLYRQPGNSVIDDYINSHQLEVHGKIYNFDPISAPEIKDYSPINSINSRTPEISANFIDNTSEVDPNTLVVILDGKDITSEIKTKDSKHFSYIPSNQLTFGNHNVQVFISNTNGFASSKQWSFKIVDTTVPIFDSYSPSTTTTIKRPVITATFSDPESGIDLTKLKVLFDGKDVTSKIKINNNTGFNYVPTSSLSYGKHNVQVTIYNQDGLSSTLRWTFTLYDPNPPILKINTSLSNKTIYNRHPVISFSVTDTDSGINIKSLIIKLDNKAVSNKYIKKDKKGYYFSSKYPLNNGNHSLYITIKDNSGHPASKTITFKVGTPGFTSGKNELWIEVNQKSQRVYVMKGGNVVKEIKCSSGKPSTPTPNGIFRIQNRGKWFLAKDKKVGAKYWVSFKGNGKYMFHSILFDKTGKYIIGSSIRNLGHKASHGCIRLPLSDAIWFYNNIPGNTRVVIFDK